MPTASRAQMASPPRFLRLAGRPVRWRLLSELARSDRRVGELCRLAGQRQSLVSYHLRRLRDGGLVTTRRSAGGWGRRGGGGGAGGVSSYVLDLAGCRERLAAAGTALHPGLGPAAPSDGI